MEKRDIIMDNIKKLELILNALFKRVAKEDDYIIVSDSFAKIFDIDIYHADVDAFYEKIKSIDGMTSGNIFILIDILLKLRGNNTENRTIIDDKIEVLRFLLKESSKVFYFK